jgi:hypothetical protein
MPASIGLFSDPAREVPLEVVELGELVAPEDFSDVLRGEPRPLYGKNTGDTHLRELEAHLKGDHIDRVQLAPDDEGLPGVWADAGQGIFVSQSTIYTGDNFTLWARAVYEPEDAELDLDFDIVFKGLSTGVTING